MCASDYTAKTKPCYVQVWITVKNLKWTFYFLGTLKINAGNTVSLIKTLGVRKSGLIIKPVLVHFYHAFSCADYILQRKLALFLSPHKQGTGINGFWHLEVIVLASLLGEVDLRIV